MKKSLIMGALLLVAAVSYAADKVYDISKPAEWSPTSMKAGKTAGSISCTTPVIVSAKVLIPVDSKHTYTFSGTAVAPAGKVGGHTLTGYYLYDKNKTLISQVNVDAVAKSESVLTAAAKKGSNILKIKANSKWKPAGHHWIAFNVQPGKVCRDISPGCIRAVKKQGGDMIITLSTALRKDYPAGTKVRIHNSGSYFYSNVFQVKNSAYAFSKTLKQNNFWAETAYIRPIILVNWILKSGTDKAKIETVYTNLKVTVKEIK